MTPYQMLREGGPAAYAAAFFGALGVCVGLVAFVSIFISRRAARALGVVALVLASFTASIGVVGMQVGVRQMDVALRDESLSPIVRERLRVEGFFEAQCAAQIAFAGALGPFVLGALAAVVGAASVRKWRLTLGALALAAVPTAGALVASTASAHPLYPFDPRNPAPWDLKVARDGVDTNLQEGCDNFDRALDEAREGSFDPDNAVPDWRDAATKCARSIFAEVRAGGGQVKRASPPSSQSEPRVWNADALLDSPLLVDESLRRQITAYKRTTFL